MLFVKVDDLKPGMRLGKPIYNKNGVLLYDRDTKLTMQAIYGIRNFGLMGLYIGAGRTTASDVGRGYQFRAFSDDGGVQYKRGLAIDHCG